MAGAGPLPAVVLVMLAFGSIHAFSLFLVPLERATMASRAEVSLVYGLALGALTAAVLLARPLLNRFPPARLLAGTCLVAAGGLALASTTPPLLFVHIGYGILFGAANGIAYAACLVVAGTRGGFWIGMVTAAYALGAAGLAALLGALLPVIGWQAAFVGLAALFALLALGSWRLLRGVAAARQTAPASGSQTPGLARHWLAYGASVAAGLMVLGHAAAIVERATGSPGQGAFATMLAGLANAGGGLAAAVAVDRFAPARLLAGTSAISLGGLVLLLDGGAIAAVLGIVLVALAYGAHIAAFPAAIHRSFGAERFAWAYGRIFTAWGAAGILAPWLAGALYDPVDGYGRAFLGALVGALLGLSANLILGRKP